MDGQNPDQKSKGDGLHSTRAKEEGEAPITQAVSGKAELGPGSPALSPVPSLNTIFPKNNNNDSNNG